MAETDTDIYEPHINLVVINRIYNTHVLLVIIYILLSLATLVTPTRQNRFVMSTEHAVSLKLPIFWTSQVSQPAVWFAQTEAQFTLRGISADETKYYHVVSVLDQETATRLLDLISCPPADNKYGTLKSRHSLIDTFGLSKQERATRLLHFRPLGDSKPSSLMDEMLALLGEHKSCMLFEQLFLERLPEEIRTQLVADKIDNHREMARKADQLWAARDASSTPGAHSVQRGKPNSRKIKSNTAEESPDNSQLCYYHRRFGEAARQCRQPCSWSGNAKANR